MDHGLITGLCSLDLFYLVGWYKSVLCRPSCPDYSTPFLLFVQKTVFSGRLENSKTGSTSHSLWFVSYRRNNSTPLFLISSLFVFVDKHFVSWSLHPRCVSFRDLWTSPKGSEWLMIGLCITVRCLCPFLTDDPKNRWVKYILTLCKAKTDRSYLSGRISGSCKSPEVFPIRSNCQFR